MKELTKAEVERLSILSEEAAEVVQRVSKIFRFGISNTKPGTNPPQTNKQLLEEELGHLSLAIATCIASGDVSNDSIKSSYEAKIEDRKQYLKHQGG